MIWIKAAFSEVFLFWLRPATRSSLMQFLPFLCSLSVDAQLFYFCMSVYIYNSSYIWSFCRLILERLSKKYVNLLYCVCQFISSLYAQQGEQRGQNKDNVCWKLGKLDHLLLGYRRMMLFPSKFTSKVPNNAKQLGRTAATEQGKKWLPMWIRLLYPSQQKKGWHWKVVLYEHQGQCLKCHTSAVRRALSLINFQRFYSSTFLKASLVETQ